MAATGVTLPAAYTITFAITPLGVSAGWSNVFRFTKSSNDCCEYSTSLFPHCCQTGLDSCPDVGEYLDRLPAVYLMPGTLTLAVGVTRPSGLRGNDFSTSYWLEAPEELPQGQRVEVTIAVSPVEVSLRIDNVLVSADTLDTAVVASAPWMHPDDGRRELDDVTVYASGCPNDPNPAANVVLQNLRVRQGSHEGRQILPCTHSRL